MDLLGWLRKHLEAADTDLLREMVLGVVQALMVPRPTRCAVLDSASGAPDWVNQRNGYRERRLDTRVGTLELARSAKIAAAPSGGEAEPSALSSARGDEPSNVAQTRPTGCRVEADRRRRRDRPG